MENSFQNGFIKHEECIFLNIIKMQSEQKISTFPSKATKISKDLGFTDNQIIIFFSFKFFSFYK